MPVACPTAGSADLLPEVSGLPPPPPSRAASSRRWLSVPVPPSSSRPWIRAPPPSARLVRLSSSAHVPPSTPVAPAGHPGHAVDAGDREGVAGEGHPAEGCSGDRAGEELPGHDPRHPSLLLVFDEKSRTCSEISGLVSFHRVFRPSAATHRAHRFRRVSRPAARPRTREPAASVTGFPSGIRRPHRLSGSGWRPRPRCLSALAPGARRRARVRPAPPSRTCGLAGRPRGAERIQVL